jgi:hypothetical protein
MSSEPGWSLAAEPDIRGGSDLQAAVQAHGVVIGSPHPEFCANVSERKEDARIQQLVAQPAMERFDEFILHWLAGPDETQLHSIVMSPAIHDCTGELGAVVNGN